jgi:hypothetical protein
MKKVRERERKGDTKIEREIKKVRESERKEARHKDRKRVEQRE